MQIFGLLSKKRLKILPFANLAVKVIVTVLLAHAFFRAQQFLLVIWTMHFYCKQYL